MKDRTLFIIIAAIGLVFAGYLWTRLEYYEEEVDAGWSIAALLNPYLAAEQFLEKQDKTVESSYQMDLVEELSVDATLFIGNANDVLDKRRSESLIAWLKKGGHVIIAAQVLNDNEDDVFLSEFGIEKIEYDYDSGKDDEFENDEELSVGDRIREANAEMQEEIRKQSSRREQRELLEKEGKLNSVGDEIAFEESQFDPGRIMTLSFDGVEGDFKILVNGNFYLDHPSFYYGDDEDYPGYEPFYWQAANNGTSFMQFYVEEGLLTVIGDGSIWSNDHIGLFDHAYLLDLLTDTTDKVVFLRGAVVPNLGELIWKNFRELSIILAVLLALWLVYRSRRFGPIIDAEELGRRSYREHLSAVGDFLWRQKKRDQLLTNAREAVWREFYKKYSAVRNASESERLETLSSVSKKSPAELKNLLSGEVPQDEFKFFQQVKILQQLRNQL